MSPQLSKRARSILYAVVTEFIATGEPVSSRTLAKKYGLELSAATIRNVLADLEDAGYLAQPHTSAGRVPTEAAFRLFIDALMRIRQLSGDEEARIRELFQELHPGTDLLREGGRLLSDLTGTVAVMMRPRIETRTVLKIRFIPTRPGELLSVIVLSDGSVENRFIAIEAPLADAELERLHNMLEQSVGDRTLSDVRDHFAGSLSEHRDEVANLSQLGLKLVNAAIERADRSMDIVIEGQARLLERTERSGNADHLKDLMRALEDREKLVMLLDRALSSARVQVFLGDEAEGGVGHSVSVVAASYNEDGRPGGAVGIVGPTRMDYPGVVPLVGATAEAISQALARSRGARPKDDPSDDR